VQHYGYRYDYKSQSIDHSMLIGELPDWAKDVAGQLVDRGLFPAMPDQVIVNEYEPGQGIKDHTDCEPCFTNKIASLSLGSKCVMHFTEKDSKRVVPVPLEPRSLVVLTGRARYEWTHGIPPRKSDKIGSQPFMRETISRRGLTTYLTKQRNKQHDR
jgi:alkylated DNA repair dioxygenase AlkB